MIKLYKLIILSCCALSAFSCSDVQENVLYPFANQIVFSNDEVTIDVGEKTFLQAFLLDKSGEVIRNISSDIRVLDQTIARTLPAEDAVWIQGVGAGDGKIQVVVSNLEKIIPVVVSCPAVDGDLATLHSDDITSNETWYAVDGIHRVQKNLSVFSPTKSNIVALNIQSCVSVVFDENAALDIEEEGTLTVEGGPRKDGKVNFYGINGSLWEGIYIRSSRIVDQVSKLVNTVIVGANVGLRVTDRQSKPVDDGIAFRAVTALNVDIVNSKTYGAILDGRVGFSVESDNLNILNGDTALRIDATAAHTIPGGRYGENTNGIIEVASGKISEIVYWRDHGVAYKITGDGVVVGGKKFLAVLKIAPSTTLLFDSGAALKVGTVLGEKGGVAFGSIKLISEQRRIYLRGVDTHSHWRGVILGKGYNVEDSLMSTVTIENAGLSSGMNEYDGDYANPDDGSLVILDSKIVENGIFKNINIKNGLGYAIIQAFPSKNVLKQTAQQDFLKENPLISGNRDPFEDNIFSPSNPLVLNITYDSGGVGSSCEEGIFFPTITWGYFKNQKPLGMEKIVYWAVMIFSQANDNDDLLWGAGNLPSSINSIDAAWYKKHLTSRIDQSVMVGETQSICELGDCINAAELCSQEKYVQERKYVFRVYALDKLLIIDQSNKATLPYLYQLIKDATIGSAEYVVTVGHK